VIDFERPKRNDIHPTMKPIGLFDYLIRNSSTKDMLVLDTFAGSGTCIMACEQDGRRCFSMELDPRYVDAIIDRWETFTGGKAVLLNG
jgi:site-specific DNA-methyltransferase (adenine-specific)